MSYNEFATVYDKLMKEMPYDQWLAYIEETWARFGKPNTAAELGCGTGTITLQLAERGVRMYGIDKSPDMLALAAVKIGEGQRSARDNVHLIEQDMVDLQLPEKMSAIYAFCDSLNYIVEQEGLQALFHHVHEHLLPGGVFSFDMWTSEQFAWYGSAGPFVWDDEQLSYIWTCDYDDERLMIEHQLIIFVQEQSGLYRKIEETHVQKAYPLEWIETALQLAGFSHLEFTADFTDEPPNGSAQRVFVTAIA